MDTEMEVEKLNITDEKQIENEDRGDEFVATDDAKELAEPTTEQETEEEKAPSEKAEKQPSSVPYERFKEVNDELKQLRAHAASLEERPKPAEQAEPVKAFDFEAKEAEYTTAVLEGDVEKAKAIRAEIRTEERVQTEKVVEAQFAHREMLREMKDVGARAFEKYPYLNHESEEANKEAIDEVLEWRSFYHAQGHSWPQALQKAVERVTKHYEVNTPKVEATEPLVSDRKVTAIKRNAEVEKRIPAPPSGQSGGGEKRIDVAKLSEKEFESLTETEMKRLRGDIV